MTDFARKPDQKTNDTARPIIKKHLLALLKASKSTTVEKSLVTKFYDNLNESYSDRKFLCVCFSCGKVSKCTKFDFVRQHPHLSLLPVPVGKSTFDKWKLDYNVFMGEVSDSDELKRAITGDFDSYKLSVVKALVHLKAIDLNSGRITNPSVASVITSAVVPNSESKSDVKTATVDIPQSNNDSDANLPPTHLSPVAKSKVKANAKKKNAAAAAASAVDSESESESKASTPVQQPASKAKAKAKKNPVVTSVIPTESGNSSDLVKTTIAPVSSKTKSDSPQKSDVPIESPIKRKISQIAEVAPVEAASNVRLTKRQMRGLAAADSVPPVTKNASQKEEDLSESPAKRIKLNTLQQQQKKQQHLKDIPPATSDSKSKQKQQPAIVNTNENDQSKTPRISTKNLSADILHLAAKPGGRNKRRTILQVDGDTLVEIQRRRKVRSKRRRITAGGELVQ